MVWSLYTYAMEYQTLGEHRRFRVEMERNQPDDDYERRALNFIETPGRELGVCFTTVSRRENSVVVNIFEEV